MLHSTVHIPNQLISSSLAKGQYQTSVGISTEPSHFISKKLLPYIGSSGFSETVAPFPWNKPAFAFTGTFFFCSSGETVTSVTSLAPLQPKKGKRRKEKVDVPPAVPAKGRRLASGHPRGEQSPWSLM